MPPGSRPACSGRRRSSRRQSCRRHTVMPTATGRSKCLPVRSRHYQREQNDLRGALKNSDRLEADMLSGIGGHLPEIIIVLVVILIIWGPGKLPDVGAAMGKGIREFRKATSEAHDQVVNATTVPPAQPSQSAPVAQV